jgi:hypothetical protein
MSLSVHVASPALEFDVSAAVCLRKRLGRAATSLKFIGLLSAVYVLVYLYNYTGAGVALVCGSLALWCACRIAKRLSAA